MKAKIQMSPAGFSTTEVLGRHPSPCISVILPLTTVLLNSGLPFAVQHTLLTSSSRLTTQKRLTLSATSAFLKLSSLPIASVLLLTPGVSFSSPFVSSFVRLKCPSCGVPDIQGRIYHPHPVNFYVQTSCSALSLYLPD